MAGITRTRSRQTTLWPITGTRTFFGTVATKGIAPDRDTCTDVVGNPNGQNPLNIQHWRLLNPLSVDGNPAPNATVFKNFPLEGFNNVLFTHAALTSGGYRDGTQAILDNHPGEALASLPNFLFELKDVPGMLKHASHRAKMLSDRGLTTGRKIRKYFSSGKASGEDWLNYHFGWAPLISDLMSVLEVSAHLERRHKTFQKVLDKGFVSKRSDLGSKTGRTTVPKYSIHSETAVFLYGSLVTETTQRKWIVARYYPEPNFTNYELRRTDRELLMEAYNLDFDMSIIWNAIPWSWLSDWFVNVGQIISLRDNKIGLKYRSSVLMTETVSKVTLTPTPVNGLTFSGTGVKSIESKERSIYNPSFFRDGSADILGPSQLGTLAALKVTRGKGSSRY